ncbi:MAG: 16S rRNA (cytidine(1402)-2'-O)-methyltransferase, partial [Pseudomonadota bacterium]|nr:16S rRNA (cytidine(1402)-2'-O)-methyltransferase [Pseudomonadota bacterium]
RELTKQFEEIVTVPCVALGDWLGADPQRTKGEFALVLHATTPPQREDDGLRVLQLLLKELPLKGAVKLAAEITGASRNELYAAALRLKGMDPGS